MSALWEVLHEKDLLSREPWLRIMAQTVKLPDGRIIEDYLQIALPNFAVIVAETQGCIVCERSYKHGARRVLLTLPAGTIDPGETALAGAKRELLEETGYASDDWHALGQRVMLANATGNIANLFVARGCSKVAEPDSSDLEDIAVELLAPQALLDAFDAGEMPLAIDSVALLPALRHMGILVPRPSPETL